MNQRFKIACNTTNLHYIRSFTKETLQKKKLKDVELNLLVLAVDEICANLILHSNKSNEEKFIELVIQDVKEGILFEVIDQGKPFNPVFYKEPTLHDMMESRRKGGIGLMLVKRIMDEVEYTKKEEFNVCRMLKKVVAIQD